MKYAVAIFVAIITLVVTLVWYSNHFDAAEHATEFQEEFGIPYPTSPSQRENATALIMTRIAELYKVQADSWDRYTELHDRLQEVKKIPPTSIAEAKKQLKLAREVDRARESHESDFGKLGAACSILYSDPWIREHYPELHIPEQSDCDFYFRFRANGN